MGTLANIIKKIDHLGYKESLMILTNNRICYDPWFEFKHIKNKIIISGIANKALLYLFYLGLEIDVSDILLFLSEENINVLKKRQILYGEGTKVKSRRCLIPYGNYYVFVDFPSFFPTCIDNKTAVYLGVDSFLLANILPKVTKVRVLDLCCGSGLHSVILDRHENEVVAVDISAEVIETANINCEINEAKNVKIIKSNLCENIKGKFELIISNPPTQVVPDNIEYPMVGNGGEDGANILSQILNNLEDKLENGGKFLCIVQLPGDECKPFFVEDLNKISYRNQWETNILIHDRMTFENQIETMAVIIKNIYQKNINRSYWEQWREKKHYSHLYNCIIRISKERKYKFGQSYVKKYDNKLRIRIIFDKNEYLLYLRHFNMDVLYSLDFYMWAKELGEKCKVYEKLIDKYNHVDYDEFEIWIFQQEERGIIQLY